MTFLEATDKATEKGRKLRLPDHPKGHFLWFHRADDVLYMQRGLLQPFSKPSPKEMMNPQWQIIEEAEE